MYKLDTTDPDLYFQRLPSRARSKIENYLKYQLYSEITRPSYSPVKTRIRIKNRNGFDFLNHEYWSFVNCIEAYCRVRKFVIDTLIMNRDCNGRKNILILVNQYHTMAILQSIISQQDLSNVEVSLFITIKHYQIERKYDIIINITPSSSVSAVRGYMKKLVPQGVFYQLVYENAISKKQLHFITNSMRLV